MSQIDINFHQEICPALKYEGWEWSKYQTFLDPRAWFHVGKIQFLGIDGDRFGHVRVLYHNNGQSCHYSLEVRVKDYPTFIKGRDIPVDAYKTEFGELKAQAIALATDLLRDNLEEILNEERTFFLEKHEAETPRTLKELKTRR